MRRLRQALILTAVLALVASSATLARPGEARLAVSLDCVGGSLTLSVPPFGVAFTAVTFSIGGTTKLDVTPPYQQTFQLRGLPKSFTVTAVIDLASGQRTTLRQLVQTCPHTKNAASARLTTLPTCRPSPTLLVSAQRLSGPAIKSVTFFIASMRFVDRRAPFRQRVSMTGLDPNFPVKAAIALASGRTISLRTTAKNCS